MRILSTVLILALGVCVSDCAFAQSFFSDHSSNSASALPHSFPHAGLKLADGSASSPSDSVSGEVKIDTSRLIWKTGSGAPQVETVSEPVQLSRITPAANPLPAAPSANYDPNVVHNSPSYAPESTRNLDWRFLTAHGVYAGAVIFDDLITMKGLGRPCGFVEGNSDLGPNPTAKSMAIHGLVEYAAVTTMDYFLKRTRVPGLSYIGAGIGTAKHLHGGIQWLNTGCF